MPVRRRAWGRWVLVGLAASVIGLAVWRWSARRLATPPVADAATAEHAAPPRPGVVATEVATGRLAGAVRDSQGAPIVGATACAQWRGDHATQGAAPCVVTAADGRFAIGALAAGPWVVLASAPTYLPAAWPAVLDGRRELLLARGEARTDVDITLASGGVVVHGIVVDIGGGPIEGAWVSAWPDRAGGVGVETRTDANGAFTFSIAPGPLGLDAGADGYASTREHAVEPSDRLLVRLEPEAVLEGIVVARGTDTPVAGARVEPGADEARRYHPGVITDDGGRFRFGGLAAGRYRPIAVAIGARGQAPASVRIELGANPPVRIEVDPMAVVTGRVLLDEGDGVPRPCPASVCTVALAGEGIHLTPVRTADDGMVLLPAVPPGRYAVRVWAAGYRVATAPPALAIAAADQGGFTWTMTRGAAIAGIVRSAAGTAIAGAQVDCWPADDGDIGGGGGTVATGPDGRFEIRGLPADAALELHVTATGYVRAELPVRSSATAIEVLLEVGAQLDVQVVDERGAGVPDVEVTVWRGADGDTRRTDGRGHVTADALTPGAVTVVVADNPTGQVEATLVAGQTTTVRLATVARDGWLRGAVVDAAGAAVADALVRVGVAGDGTGVSATHDDRGPPPVITDAAGGFHVGGLAPGTYAVRAYRRGGVEAVVVGVALGSDVRVVMPAPVTLTGEVWQGGARAAAFAVSAYDAGTGVTRDGLFTGGRFEFAELTPGTYTIDVSARDARAEQVVTLTAGQPAAVVRVDLPALVRVRGTLVSLGDGQPLVGVRVGAGVGRPSMSELDAGRQVVTDARGRFELDGVPIGPASISVAGAAAHGAVVFPFEATPGGLDVGAISVPGAGAGVAAPGELGFDLADDVEPPFTMPLRVGEVDPDGPAARAGLAVGDVIERVGAVDVTGARAYLVMSLCRVAPGTTVTLGLRNGRSVAIVVALRDER